MSYRYADAWYPPMPVLEIQLGYPEQTLSLELHTAIVDTGADGTLVPVKLIERLNAPITDQVRVRGQWGGGTGCACSLWTWGSARFASLLLRWWAMNKGTRSSWAVMCSIDYDSCLTAPVLRSKVL